MGRMAGEQNSGEDRYLDRELSWLAFNTRVLELAEDSDVPLLERTRFLSIFSSNLDEFYMVRVAGLKRRIAAGVAVPAVSGLLPREVLERTLERSRELMTRQTRCFRDDVLPALHKEDIELVRWDDLADSEHLELRTLFRERIFPVLTPLAVDPAHPFPYISGLSLNLAVMVRNPRNGTEHFARVKVPPNFPRFLPVAEQRFVPLEDVIAAHLSLLFPGMEIQQHHTFRVTRNEDVEVEEDDAENLLTAMERELMRRRFGPAVRLEVEETVDPHVLDLLQRELGVSHHETFSLPGPLDLTGLSGIADLDRAELKYRPFLPATHRDLPDVESAAPADMFAAISKGDVLVHHPYDSFSTSVQRFIEQAAADPRVLAIKQTLYRTSGDSPIVDALVDAAEAGKQVLALVEIKARFDEQANITWARKLEQAGVHVVYGLVGLKTHCKLCLVVRDESTGIRRYTHIGTGNYHPKTARLYEDLGLLTAETDVAEDVNQLFNTLSGYSIESDYQRLLVAPHALRSGIIERIHREIEHHAAGRPAQIRFKLNSLVDEATIDALYEASQAGVPVDVWIRGICSLRAGVPGLSENIRVVSVLGRFLEHSRVLAFENGGDPEYWIGSADLMHRNLDRRVEAMVQLRRPEHHRELEAMFDLALDPQTSRWQLCPDGSWQRHHLDADGAPLTDLQHELIERKRRRKTTT
ncbi:RNA degradosome polyphosphate kinase [Phytoactinopolyspora halotolerans]|uniref:Polyphosphate kinase n=2 Tax=Phytoactinopolyspora halotolerans TaxID=1981512 RepID=A0A6L9S5W8_9ACTN|nr:RNA degradosome polyphosphate kinase [Phytoactinopolyspora halotolerans]